MDLWTAREMCGDTLIYATEPRWNKESSDWETYGYQVTNKAISDLACRDVKPGEKRKLKVFDPINEVVEYEDALEEKHRRLVDAVNGAVRGYRNQPMRVSAMEDFSTFLRTEGYIS